jgi:hypothetical protein
MPGDVDRKVDSVVDTRLPSGAVTTRLPPVDLKSGMLAAGIPEAIADRMLDLERYFREDRASTITDDVTRVTGRDQGDLPTMCASPPCRVCGRPTSNHRSADVPSRVEKACRFAGMSDQ